MNTMLAAVYHGPHDLRLEEAPVPEIGPDEILLRVRGAGICATDFRVMHGGHRFFPPGTKRILGHEAAGEIARIGRQVSGYQEGQRVFIAPNIGCGHCRHCVTGHNCRCVDYTAIGLTIDGAFAEYMRIPAKAVEQGNVIPLADGVSLAEACLIEPLACVLRGQEALHIIPGETVLVVGAGPIGVIHARLAGLHGAGQVFISEVIPARVEQARRMGVGQVVNPQAEDLEQVLLQGTSGRGPDVVIVAAPSPQAQQDAVRLAAIGGRICFFGGLPKDKPMIHLDANLIHYKELIVTGSTANSTANCWRAVEIVNAGRLRLDDVLSACYPLKDVHAAFAAAEDRRSLKVVVEP